MPSVLFHDSASPLDRPRAVCCASDLHPLLGTVRGAPRSAGRRDPGCTRWVGPSVRPAVGLLFVLAGLLGPTSSLATQPVSEEDLRAGQPPVTGPRGGGVTWPEERINPLFELDQIAAFLDLWQEKDPGSPDFGGMIEAEAGPLGNVIQTDNTLEAIWLWSRYTELTGRTTYLQNIADAWTYCETYPAWLEEGSSNGYYRAHNCAWALTAESAYRAATGDTGFLDHAETAAEWIEAHPLFLNSNQKLNALVQGWTSGNLYLYGEELGRADWMTAAVSLGNAVWNDYILFDPPTLLATETWAMSSGTMVWGLCNSVFRDDPAAGTLWIETYGAFVDTFQTWYDNPGDGFDWDNSWNVAYANAHFAMSEVSGDPVWAEYGDKLTRQLLSYDTDDDGGIPATTQDPVTEDMSWVTSYLGKFGVVRLVGTPRDVDAGVLAFVTPADGAEFALGEPIPIEVEVSNFGLDDLTGVEVALEGAVTVSAEVDLPFAARERIVLEAGWIPPVGGDHELTCRVTVPGDEDPSNDTFTIVVTVNDPAALPGDGGPVAPGDGGPAAPGDGGPLAGGDPGSHPAPLLFAAPAPNPAGGVSRWALALESGEAANVEVVAADGRVLRRWSLPAGPARVGEIAWDGRDAGGRAVAAGVYYVRAVSGPRTAGAPIVRLAR
jgi:hypothetical protein